MVGRLNKRVLAICFIPTLLVIVTISRSQVTWVCGKYTGTGVARSITGLGFQPDFIMIKADNASYPAVVKISSMVANESQDVTSTAAFLTDAITSFDADGFTLGTNVKVNNNSTTYYFEAFKNDANFQVGSYVGDGVTKRNVTVGWATTQNADFIIVVPGIWAGSPVSHSIYNVNGSANNWMRGPFTGSPNTIVGSSGTDGFDVDGVISASNLNTSGKTYYYAAWNEFDGGMKVDKYTGNGSTSTISTLVSSLTFAPNLVFTYEFQVTGKMVHRTGWMAGPNISIALNPPGVGGGDISALEAADFKVTGNNTNLATITYYYAAFGGATGINLPIKLLEFKAKQVTDYIELDWITAVEVNNSYFTIERLSANEEKYETVGIVKGAGTYSGSLYYNYTDLHPVDGYSYYRLKQTDYDGKYTYSDIVAVKFDNNKIKLLKIFPNPIADQTTCSVYSPEILPAMISITDVTGKTIFRKSAGLNYGTNNIEFNTSGLSKGLYLLKVETVKGMTVKKFIK